MEISKEIPSLLLINIFVFFWLKLAIAGNAKPILSCMTKCDVWSLVQRKQSNLENRRAAKWKMINLAILLLKNISKNRKIYDNSSRISRNLFLNIHRYKRILLTYLVIWTSCTQKKTFNSGPTHLTQSTLISFSYTFLRICNKDKLSIEAM